MSIRVNYYYCILLLTVSKTEFCSQFSHLDKLQYIGFIP